MIVFVIGHPPPSPRETSRFHSVTRAAPRTRRASRDARPKWPARAIRLILCSVIPICLITSGRVTYLLIISVHKQKEEERLEEQRKLKEIESKIPDKNKKKETVLAKSKPNAKKTQETNLIQIINDEIVKNINLINSVNEKKDKYDKKLKQLKELIVYYDNLDESKLKIDLVDLNVGNRIEIDLKENDYANTYLVDKQCYDLVFQKISKYFIIYK